ncbi:MAG: biopolymer transporter ExbD [Verrucomicrobiota bacterium]
MKANVPQLEDQEFDITPMIDVVFLLIVFFMVVAAEITKQIEVDLPEADKSIVPEETGRRMEVSIEEDGKIYVRLREVSVEELVTELRAGNSQIEGFKVFLRADSRAPHKFVNDVMTACAEAEVFDVIFATFQDK